MLYELTFGAQSCTGNQMLIFAQNIDPAKYFCLCSLDHESTKIRLNFRKQIISDNEVIKQISCSSDLITLTEKNSK